MKTLKILKIRYKNFKGLKYHTFEPGGEDMVVSGVNGSGKTTLQDGYFWCLFGKDSQGKKDFKLKPVDADGQDVHNLETEVEAFLLVDEKPVTLKKVFYEKWTRKTGDASTTFTGHTTDYFIDDVPKSMREYEAFVETLAGVDGIDDEFDSKDIFKLVTSPFEFNNLHWTERRSILFDMAGDMTDQDIIDANAELAPLSEILVGISIDDHKAKAQARQRKINDELKKIPVRIDELTLANAEAKKPRPQDKNALGKKIAELEEKLKGLQNNERLSEKMVRVHEINKDIVMLQTESERDQAEIRKPLLDKKDDLDSERRLAINRIRILREEVDAAYKRNADDDASKAALLKKYKEIDAEQPKKDDLCPTCGQFLPDEMIIDAHEAFFMQKAERLKEILDQGLALKVAIADRGRAIEKKLAEIKTIEEKLDTIEEELFQVKSDLEKAPGPPPELEALNKEKEILRSEISALENGSTVQETNTKRQIAEAKEELEIWLEEEAAWKAAERNQSRIDELAGQEKILAKRLEQIAQELHLIEKFIQIKARMLEEDINSRFKLAKFQLFETQINGSIKEVCRVLYNGIDFNRGLNSAARVNVGLDIVNTLIDAFQFSAPVWVDNRESINELIPINAQVISLNVSNHKTLNQKAA